MIYVNVSLLFFNIILECDLNCSDCDKTADNCIACKNEDRKKL